MFELPEYWNDGHQIDPLTWRVLLTRRSLHDNQVEVIYSVVICLEWYSDTPVEFRSMKTLRPRCKNLANRVLREPITWGCHRQIRVSISHITRNSNCYRKQFWKWLWRLLLLPSFPHRILNIISMETRLLHTIPWMII